VKAWLFAYTGNSDQARFWLEMAEQAVPETEKTEVGRHIRGHIAAIHCYLLLYGNDMPLCIQEGYKALEYLPENDQPTRISTSITLGSALRVDGNMIEAIKVLQEAIPISRMLENDATTIRAIIGLATAQFESGRLRDAVITFNDAIKLSERVNPDGSISHLPPASNAYNRLGDTFYCMNDLDSALECVKVGITLAEKWGRASAVWDGNMYLTRILKSLGDYEGANLALQKAENISRKISDQCKRTTDAVRALFWLDQGEIDTAIRWAEQQDFPNISKITFDDIDILLIYARVLLARNDTDIVNNLLTCLLATAEKARAQTYEIEISIDLALAYQKRGLHEEAIGALIRAVKIGERIDHVRVFIDRGKALQPVFCEIISRGISTEFVKMLLIQIDKGSGHEKKGITASLQSLIEPLSERELQVLRYLTTNLSTPEIARELILAPTTIRTHVRNIYDKLGTHRRIETIQKAKDLGLI
jgi:LuxR family maltose regulon positive regulatory protein